MGSLKKKFRLYSSLPNGPPIGVAINSYNGDLPDDENESENAGERFGNVFLDLFIKVSLKFA